MVSNNNETTINRSCRFQRDAEPSSFLPGVNFAAVKLEFETPSTQLQDLNCNLRVGLCNSILYVRLYFLNISLSFVLFRTHVSQSIFCGLSGIW
jgi:hypothetical protein